MPADTGRNVPPRPLAALAALGRMAGANLVGRVTSTPDGVLDANDAFLRIAGYSRQELEEGRVHWRALSPPEWTDLDDDAVAELKAYGSYGPPGGVRRGPPASAGPAAPPPGGAARDRDIGAWCQSLLTALTQDEILADDVALACIELRGLR